MPQEFCKAFPQNTSRVDVLEPELYVLKNGADKMDRNLFLTHCDDELSNWRSKTKTLTSSQKSALMRLHKLAFRLKTGLDFEFAATLTTVRLELKLLPYFSELKLEANCDNTVLVVFLQSSLATLCFCTGQHNC